MIVLHGLGDSMAGYLWLPELLELEEMNYLLVNAPDPYYTGFSWYDFAGNPGPGVARSRGLLMQLLKAQIDAGFPADQMVLFGFSQGCLMTLDVGARFPGRLAGCIGVSGYVHEPERLIRELPPEAREQRFLVTHGTHDPLIPIDQVRLQIGMLKAAGLRVEWHEFQKAHTLAGEPEIALIRQFIRAGY
jgi:phospholipase/carboxylesterase